MFFQTDSHQYYQVYLLTGPTEKDAVRSKFPHYKMLILAFSPLNSSNIFSCVIYSGILSYDNKLVIGGLIKKILLRDLD